MVQSSENDCGASLVEYSLLVALISIVVLSAILSTGEGVADKLCETTGAVNDQFHEVTYNAELQCCGYQQNGFGGGFECIG